MIRLSVGNYDWFQDKLYWMENFSKLNFKQVRDVFVQYIWNNQKWSWKYFHGVLQCNQFFNGRLWIFVLFQSDVNNRFNNMDMPFEKSLGWLVNWYTRLIDNGM